MIILLKKQQQSQMLRNRNVIISDKRAQRGPAGTPAAPLSPGGSTIPCRAVGCRLGTWGSSGLRLQPCSLSPYTRCKGHSPHTDLWGRAVGLPHISGTLLELRCGMGTPKQLVQIHFLKTPHTWL